MLLLSYWDGKSLLPCDLSFHRENKKKEYGLTKKQQKEQFTKKRDSKKDSKKDSKSYFEERYKELDTDKLSVSIKMLKRCIKSGILGSYVLMDSWFVTDFGNGLN
jgi:hypothetical protein